MTAESLVSIEVNKLFEEKSIAEIQNVQKRLQQEIERKKEELRMMVGERYRELIEAVDMIGDMKNTAGAVVSHADGISTMCKQMQQHYLNGFVQISSEPEPAKKNEAYYSVAVQIKLLLEIPDAIWSAMDNENYLLGAQLFLLARYIHTGLQLQGSLGHELNTSSIIDTFPIITHQWNIISKFHKVLLNGSCEKLKSHELSMETASNCLGTLFLLENVSVLELLKKFLDLRTEAFEKILTSDNKSGVNMCIWALVKLIIETTSVIYGCFYDDSINSYSSKGFLWIQIKSVVDTDAQPSVSLLNLNNEPLLQYLPPLIQEFRPSVKNTVDSALVPEMQEAITTWLNGIHDFIKRDGPNLLATVGSVCALYSIQQDVPDTPNNWDLICRHLFTSNILDPWKDYFYPLVLERARVLVSKSWHTICGELKNELKSVMQKELSLNDKIEHNVSEFVWDDVLSDDESTDHSLHMKMKGYSSTLEKLCLKLDSQLGTLVQDLYEENGGDLEDHLQSCTVAGINELIEFLRSNCLPSGNENTIVFMARFLLSLCDLVPNLQKCLTPSHLIKNVILQSTTTQEISKWPQVCSLLNNQSLWFWSQWQTSVSRRLNNIMKDVLKFSDLLQSFPKWDIINIIEEADEDRRIDSQIMIPSQPSLPLQSLLYAVTVELCHISPHTLPRKIHLDLIESLLDNILDHYISLLDSKKLMQSEALQFLQDVKYLSSLLLLRDNKVLVSKVQSLSEKLEGLIDPFDLDVFSPYVQNNIKQAVHRSHVLLGVLLPWPEKLVVTSGQSASSADTLEDPSILSLCTGTPWFPVLPITGAPSVRIQRPKSQVKSLPSSKPTSELSNVNIMRTSAAAVLNALSSDWFGPS